VEARHVSPGGHRQRRPERNLQNGHHEDLLESISLGCGEKSFFSLILRNLMDSVQGGEERGTAVTSIAGAPRLTAGRRSAGERDSSGSK